MYCICTFTCMCVSVSIHCTLQILVIDMYFNCTCIFRQGAVPVEDIENLRDNDRKFTGTG